MSALLLPAVVLMLVTMLVWLTMSVRRIVATKGNKVNPQSLATPEQVTECFDDRTNAPGNCFKNMFEAPVIFYALIAFIAASGTADQLFVNLSWAFVALRSVQAAVHCTYNRVMHRFYAYFVSTLILWVMVVRFFLIVF